MRRNVNLWKGKQLEVGLENGWLGAWIRSDFHVPYFGFAVGMPWLYLGKKRSDFGSTSTEWSLHADTRISLTRDVDVGYVSVTLCVLGFGVNFVSQASY